MTDARRPVPEPSTYRVDVPHRLTGMAVYRRVLLVLLGLLVVTGTVLVLCGVSFGHGAMIAVYIVAGLSVGLFVGSFLPDDGSPSSDPSGPTDYAVQNG